MNVGVAHSDSNPNSSWMSGRGGWLSYALGVLLIHLVIRIQPYLDGVSVWTLTNVIHDLIMYILLHQLKGAPWHNTDQGRSRRLTHWEQIDSGLQFTGTRKFLTLIPILLRSTILLHQLKGAPWHNTYKGRSRRLTYWEQIDSGLQFTGTRKFLTLIPILLFLITCYETNYEVRHFVINAIACALVLIPKLPQFHKVRLFDINKY